MIEAATIWIAQFVYIALRGWQTLNIVNGHRVRAAGCSLLLGLCGLYITGIIALTVVRGGSWLVYLSFLSAGPCGIVTSMMIGANRK